MSKLLGDSYSFIDSPIALHPKAYSQWNSYRNTICTKKNSGSLDCNGIRIYASTAAREYNRCSGARLPYPPDPTSCRGRKANPITRYPRCIQSDSHRPHDAPNPSPPPRPRITGERRGEKRRGGDPYRRRGARGTRRRSRTGRG